MVAGKTEGLFEALPALNFFAGESADLIKCKSLLTLMIGEVARSGRFFDEDFAAYRLSAIQILGEEKIRELTRGYNRRPKLQPAVPLPSCVSIATGGRFIGYSEEPTLS